MITFLEYLEEAQKEVKFDSGTMRWITIRDENNQPQKLLIKKKGGEVLGGMGGEHTGEKLSQVFDKVENDKESIAKGEKPKSKQESGAELHSSVKKMRDDSESVHVEAKLYKADISKALEKMPQNKKEEAKKLKQEADMELEGLEYSKEILSNIQSIANLHAKGKNLSDSQKRLVQQAQKASGETDEHKALERFAQMRINGNKKAIAKLNSIEKTLNGFLKK